LGVILICCTFRLIRLLYYLPMERMKQLTVCIDDGLQWEVVYRAEISHTEEDYQELKSDLEFVREENKKLRDYADNLDSENDNQAIEIEELKKENKKLKEKIDELEKCNLNLQERLDRKEELNKSYRKEIKDHQLYEEKLEHRIIELEELLHWE
jgi:predicted nuclease with TOPRIM domain